jgi:hypothetical protein
MQVERRRPRREYVEYPFRDHKLRRSQRRSQGFQGGFLFDGRHGAPRDFSIAAKRVDVVLTAQGGRGRGDLIPMVEEQRDERFLHHRQGDAALDHRLTEAVERGATDGHQATQFGGWIGAVRPLVGTGAVARI